MNLVYSVRVPTPDGVFSAVLNAQAVLASGWSEDVSYFLPLIHASLRAPLAEIRPLDRSEALTAELDPLDRRDALGQEDSSGILVAHQVIQAVEAFYDGDPTKLGAVPVQQKSGPYRERAWEVLRQVAPGQPVTYAQYAQRTGNPKAVRAAASACAMNAAALFVPCHRVLRTDGSLGGFRYGLEIKERLLARESVPSATVNA